MSEALRYQIGERRICWPDPSLDCLQGACGRCNQSPFRALPVIEGHARMTALSDGGSQDGMAAYEYGLANGFFGAETRASMQDLRSYADDVGLRALCEMADGMPGGTHAKSRSAVLIFVLGHRRDVLDESFRLTRGRVWSREEIG